MSEELIRVDNLTFYYPESVNPVLDDLNLSIDRGQFVGFTGPAGAGKTTLSFCFNGIIPHYQAGRVGGLVYIEGVALKEIPAPQLAAKIGSVFQDPEAQIVSLTVEEELAFGLENLNFPSNKIEERIVWALEAMSIAHLRNRSTNSLSGGQKQRVVLAAVLAMRPKILVLDEPTSELDPMGTEEIFKTLYALNRQYGITVIIFEQKIDQLAPFLDRIVVLDKGKIVADGLPSKVLAQQTVFDLGIRIPQVSELALLWGERCREVPITIQQGLSFVRERWPKGRF